MNEAEAISTDRSIQLEEGYLQSPSIYERRSMSFDAAIQISMQQYEDLSQPENIDNQGVSDHYSSLSREEAPLTHTQDFEFQQIEDAQGENTIIRNLDLEGDDYYEEEYIHHVHDTVPDYNFADEDEQLDQAPLRPEVLSAAESYEQDVFESHIGINEIPANLLMSEVPSIPPEEQVNAVLESHHPSGINMKQSDETFQEIQAQIQGVSQTVKVHKTPNKKKLNQNLDGPETRNYKKILGKSNKAVGSHRRKDMVLEKKQPIKSNQATPQLTRDSKTQNVDTVIVGSGPAALGFLVNAIKTGRLNDLMRQKEGNTSFNNGLAILSDDIQFGGGCLGQYGINSNTSAAGFLKCMNRATNKKKQENFEAKTKNFIKQNENAIKQAETNLNNLIADAKVKLKARAHSFVPVRKAPHSLKVQSVKGQALNVAAAPNLANQNQVDVASDEEKTKPEVKHPEILIPFKDLAESRLVKTMKSVYGKQVVPLTLVGHFLNFVGNFLLHYIFQLFSTNERQTRIFYPMHKVEQIQLLNNGEFLIKVSQTKFKILVPPLTVEEQDVTKLQQLTEGMTFSRKFGNNELWVSNQKEEVYFRCKSVILASGGDQIVHPEFFKWFPQKINQRESIITSDYFLKRDGFHNTMISLGQLSKPPGQKKRIVIVGGSHSGFSCTWMLLNQRPAHELDKCLSNTHINKRAQGAAKKSVAGCQFCCQCQKVEARCKYCICKCLGFFEYNEWNSKDQFQMFPDSKPLNFEQDTEQIIILYKDEVKVFYQKVQDAINDGYTCFDKSAFANDNGYLYSFTGLRGDAKELYRSIMKGTEKRVRLVKTQTIKEQEKYINEADLVIWACGYQTRAIDIVEMGPNIGSKTAKPCLKKLQLSQMRPGTQYDVDNKCRVILNNNIVLNKVFACGIGYPVRTNDGKTTLKVKGETNRALNPRADGFSLYMNIVGDILIKNILPKDQKIKMVSHKIFPATQAILANKLPTAQYIMKQSPAKRERAVGSFKGNLVQEVLKQQKISHSTKKNTEVRQKNQRAYNNDIKGYLMVESKSRLPKSSHSQNRKKVLNKHLKLKQLSDLIVNGILIDDQHNVHLMDENIALIENENQIQINNQKFSQYLETQMTNHQKELVQVNSFQVEVDKIVSREEELEKVLVLAQNAKAMSDQLFSQSMASKSQGKQKKQTKDKQVLVNSSMTNLPAKIKYNEKSPYTVDHNLYKQQPPQTQNFKKCPKAKVKMTMHKNESNSRIQPRSLNDRKADRGSKVVQTLMQKIHISNINDLVSEQPEFVTQSSDMFPPIISKTNTSHQEKGVSDFKSRYINGQKFGQREDAIQKIVSDEHNKVQETKRKKNTKLLFHGKSGSNNIPVLTTQQELEDSENIPVEFIPSSALEHLVNAEKLQKIQTQTPRSIIPSNDLHYRLEQMDQSFGMSDCTVIRNQKIKEDIRNPYISDNVRYTQAVVERAENRMKDYIDQIDFDKFETQFKASRDHDSGSMSNLSRTRHNNNTLSRTNNENFNNKEKDSVYSNLVNSMGHSRIACNSIKINEKKSKLKPPIDLASQSFRSKNINSSRPGKEKTNITVSDVNMASPSFNVKVEKKMLNRDIHEMQSMEEHDDLANMAIISNEEVLQSIDEKEGFQKPNKLQEEQLRSIDAKRGSRQRNQNKALYSSQNHTPGPGKPEKSLLSAKFKSSQREKQAEFLKEPQTLICQERSSVVVEATSKAVAQALAKQQYQGSAPDKSPPFGAESKDKMRLSQKGSLHNQYPDKKSEKKMSQQPRSANQTVLRKKDGCVPGAPKLSEKQVNKEIPVNQ